MALDIINYQGPDLIKCAANLAHRGLLGCVSSIWLGDIWTVGDLSIVPTHHLASLVSSAMISVNIDNVTGCDLVSVLDSLNCEKLSIRHQRLGREETQALVRAMESRVENVLLKDVDIELGIETLTEYSGQGRCRVLTCTSETDLTYVRELMRWAGRKEWFYGLTPEQDDGEEEEDNNIEEGNDDEEDQIPEKVYEIHLIR